MAGIMKLVRVKFGVLYLLVLCTTMFHSVPMLSAHTVRFWIEPEGHIAENSPTQTHKKIEEALKEISNICDIEFKKVTSENSARVRYYFRPQSQIEGGALGMAHGPKKYVLINSSSKVGVTQERGDRYVQLVAQHAMLHMLRWKNSSNQSSLKIPYRLPRYFNQIPDDFNRLDVYYLQKKFGKHKDRANNETSEKGWKHRDRIPDVTFIPATLAAVGRQHQQDVRDGELLHQERNRLLAERDESVDFIFRSAKQLEVLANLDLILAHNVQQIASGLEWHLINFYWIGVHGYHFDYYGPQKEE